MHTTLLERGDFVVLISPEALLEELGITAGTAMDLRIEKNGTIATPLRTRDGLAEDANRIGAEPLTRAERDWLAFGDDRDESHS